MNSITHFDFKSNAVRIAFDCNNEPLFCLADVCKALDIKNQNPKRFDLNLRGLHKMSSPTSSGVQTLTFISEENLYRIVFRSNKPEALNFQNWVFADVLPSIRKTGTYNARQAAYEELNRLCKRTQPSHAHITLHHESLLKLLEGINGDHEPQPQREIFNILVQAKEKGIKP